MNEKMNELAVKLEGILKPFKDYPYKTIFIDRSYGKEKYILTAFLEGEHESLLQEDKK